MSNASPRAGMPSWNPFARGRPRANRRFARRSPRDAGRSPRAARESLNNPASGRAVVDYLASVAARRADDITSGAATAAAIAARRAAAPDSDVVARYKAGQAKVIADASK